MLSLTYVSHPEKPAIADKMNIFLDYYHLTRLFMGWSADFPFESHLSILKKVLYRLNNFKLTFSEKYIKNYLNNTRIQKQPIFCKNDQLCIAINTKITDFLTVVNELKEKPDTQHKSKLESIINQLDEEYVDLVVAEIFQMIESNNKKYDKLFYLCNLLLTEYYNVGMTDKTIMGIGDVIRFYNSLLLTKNLDDCRVLLGQKNYNLIYLLGDKTDTLSIDDNIFNYLHANKNDFLNLKHQLSVLSLIYYNYRRLVNSNKNVVYLPLYGVQFNSKNENSAELSLNHRVSIVKQDPIIMSEANKYPSSNDKDINKITNPNFMKIKVNAIEVQTALFQGRELANNALITLNYDAKINRGYARNNNFENLLKAGSYLFFTTNTYLFSTVLSGNGVHNLPFPNRYPLDNNTMSRIKSEMFFNIDPNLDSQNPNLYQDFEKMKLLFFRFHTDQNLEHRILNLWRLFETCKVSFIQNDDELQTFVGHILMTTKKDLWSSMTVNYLLWLHWFLTNRSEAQNEDEAQLIEELGEHPFGCKLNTYGEFNDQLKKLMDKYKHEPSIKLGGVDDIDYKAEFEYAKSILLELYEVRNDIVHSSIFEINNILKVLFVGGIFAEYLLKAVGIKIKSYLIDNKPLPNMEVILQELATEGKKLVKPKP